jgi:phosphoribosylanthranilate isomerase
MTKVKICGITNLEDALMSVRYGADMLGFNFYSGSKRYLTPDDARLIVDQLPITSGNVGVFVNEPIERVLEIADFVGLDAIQLHGDEEPAYVRRLNTSKAIIKAIRPRSFAEACAALDFDCDAILMDSYSAKDFGGTGSTGNWQAARAVWGLVPMLYLAGGLTTENVADAIRTVSPYAVDVTSGVESAPGKKDLAKVAAFIKAAKEAV